MTKMQALRVNRQTDYQWEIKDIPRPTPATGEVLVKIDYSGLNYKDALALTDAGVIRSFPRTPGIDLAGVVVESADPNFTPGDKVYATGYGLGVSWDGGFSEYQTLPGKWLLPLPEGLTAREAMAFGTAGLTAALCVAAITQKVQPDEPILITGATGGVGSMAFHLLEKLGYHALTILSRKEDAASHFPTAQAVIAPDTFLIEEKPLNSQLFAGIVDTVGGDLLAKLLPHVRYGGIVAACGNAGGIKLNTTVLPFILRGITLAGIDSVNATSLDRKAAWALLVEHKTLLQEILLQEISLAEVPTVAASLRAGTHTGRTIVKM